MEEGLDINELRMLAAGNEVVRVEVGGVGHVEQREVAADSFVEPCQLLHTRSSRTGREFDPPVLDAIENLIVWNAGSKPSAFIHRSNSRKCRSMACDFGL